MKNYKKIFKFLILTITIILTYRIWIFLINANNNSTIVSKTNSSNFRSIYSSEISKTWVAISTNIWIKFSENNLSTNSSVNISNEEIYKDLFSFEDLKTKRKNVEEILITNNMLWLKEYYSILKTDFKTMIQNTNDRAKTLEWIYNQLRLRYNSTAERIKILEKQKEILVKEYNSIDSKITESKKKISENYKKIDTVWVNSEIENFLELKNDQNLVRTYIVFINNFLNNYNALNRYSWNLLNSLAINKDAIEKWSYVVLPNSGNEILKEYGLLLTEDEYKKLKEN